MDAPPIQYARTADGVDIAWWSVGAGPALVVLPNVSSNHASHLWAIPPSRAWFERLAAQRRVVYLDPRGTGLSHRAPADLSAQSVVEDVRAVTTAAGLRGFALWAEFNSVAAAILAAVDDGLPVEHLLLWHGFLSYEGVKGKEPLFELNALFARDSDSLFDVLVPAVVGSDCDGATVASLVELGKQSMDAASARQFAVAQEAGEWNAEAAAGLVDVPTLVLHRRKAPLVPLALAQELAAAIPKARLALIDGDSWYPYLGESSAVVAAIDAFLGTQHAGPLAPGLRTLLFTDLEASTALTQSLGDEAAQEVVRGHDAAVREALQAHGGEEVKHLGDGIMGAFGSAVAAVQAALQIQGDLAGSEVRVRVGLNAGEPIHEDDDYFGSAVQLAARVCGQAEPGQILVPQVVRDLCLGKGFTFEDRGEGVLKGFAEPVRLFAVREGG